MTLRCCILSGCSKCFSVVNVEMHSARLSVVAILGVVVVGNNAGGGFVFAFLFYVGIDNLSLFNPHRNFALLTLTCKDTHRQIV